MAFVRLAPGKHTARCSCGKVSVESEGTDVVIRGGGWIREYQWVMCRECDAGIRFAPRLVWETESGDRYTTREYIREGERRKLT